MHSNSRVGFFVFIDQLELSTGHSAGGIDLARGKVQAPFHLLANACIGTGQWRHDADADGLVLRSSAACNTGNRQGDGSVSGFHVCLLFGLLVVKRQGEAGERIQETQVPVKRARRLSWKASTPSRKSSELRRRE